MFRLLIKVRLLSILNIVKDQWRRSPLISISMGIGALVLFITMSLGFFLLFRIADTLQVLPEMVYQANYYMFLLLLAGAVPFVAFTLLQSEDYHLLFAAPVSPRSIIAAKLLDATVTNSLQFSVLGIPAIVASAAAIGIAWWGWLFVVLLIALFVLLPALLTAASLLLALTLVGMRRLRAAITLINVLMGVVVCITFVMETRNLPLKVNSGTHRLNGFEPVIGATSPAAHLAPSHWFAQALIGLGGHGDLKAAFVSMAVILISSLLLFLFCMILGGRMISMASLAEAESADINFSRATRPGALNRSLISRPIAAMIVKDLKLIRRDPMLASQLAVPLILYAVPFLLTLQNQSLSGPTEMFPFSVGIVFFILYMQTSILSLSLLGMEAQGAWTILSAPKARSSLLLAKWATSVLISGSIGVSLCLFAGLVFRAEITALVGVLAAIVCSSCALCALGVGTSALFPRFIHENPAMRVSSWALVIGFIASTGYLIASGLLIGLGLFFTENEMSGTTKLPPILWLFCGLFLLLSVFSTLAPLMIGARRLEEYEWLH